MCIWTEMYCRERAPIIMEVGKFKIFGQKARNREELIDQPAVKLGRAKITNEAQWPSSGEFSSFS